MNTLITGTSRGIGFELTKIALSERASVIALARNAEAAKNLQQLKNEHSDKLSLLSVDLTSPNAVEVILNEVSKWNQLDLIVNNAGIFKTGDGLQDFIESFHVNSIVPYLLTTALLPSLKKSKLPIVAHITSQMGSIDDNQSGGHYAYRSSKAALNMINKSLTIDQPWLTTLVIHPGWVQTDMGGKNAPVKPTDSAEGIWRVIKSATAEKSGKFLNYKGESIKW